MEEVWRTRKWLSDLKLVEQASHHEASLSQPSFCPGPSRRSPLSEVTTEAAGGGRRLQTHGCCVYIFTCCRYIFLLLSSTCCSVLLCSSSQMLLSSLTLSGEWRSFTLSSKWVLGVCVCLCVHVFVLLKLWGYKSVYTVTSWRQVRASKASSTCLMKSKNKHRLRHKMKPIPLLSSKTVFCHKNS